MEKPGNPHITDKNGKWLDLSKQQFARCSACFLLFVVPGVEQRISHGLGTTPPLRCVSSPLSKNIFWNKLLSSCPGWPWTYDPPLMSLLASKSLVGLQVYTTSPSSVGLIKLKSAKPSDLAIASLGIDPREKKTCLYRYWPTNTHGRFIDNNINQKQLRCPNGWINIHMMEHTRQ